MYLSVRGCDTEPPNLSKPRRHDKTQCTLSVERKLEGIAVCENTIEYPITPDRWIPYPHTWPTSNVLGTQSNLYQIFLATAECFISSQFNSNNLKHNLSGVIAVLQSFTTTFTCCGLANAFFCICKTIMYCI